MEPFLDPVRCTSSVNGFTDFPFPSLFNLSESEQREQTQPVAGSYCQESGDRRESGGKQRPPTHEDLSPKHSHFTH